MKLPIISILSGVALTTFSGIAEAAIVIPPTGLAPGSEYRLVFVTSGLRPATSTNIADYNTFVQNAARGSSVLNTALTAAGFNPLSVSWTAIASTGTVNARVNTQTQATDTSRPIYRLDGVQVATSYADLWDGSIGVPINVTENDQPNFTVNVWTGTNVNGGTQTPLGPGNVTFGNSFLNDSLWMNGGLLDATLSRAFYGISSVLTVPGAPTTTTPEPSSLLGFITLGGLMLGGAVRKAQK